MNQPISQHISSSIRVFISTLLILFALNPFTAAAEDSAENFLEKKEMKIGVLAFRGEEAARKMWTPMANYLSNKISGYQFRIIPLDLKGMQRATKEGSIDFVLTNSGNYVDLEARYGASRLATLRNFRRGKAYTVFGAVILTRADYQNIKTLSDLKGKSFMAVSKNAFGGFQMAWREFKDNNIDPFSDFSRLEFSGFPQDDIVYAIRDGLIDAGTVRSDTLSRMAQEGKIQISTFRILNEQSNNEYPFPHSTRVYPEWPFAKLKHTPEQLGQQLAIALLTLPPESTVAVSGKSAGWTIPLDYGPVHDLFRILEIGPYKTLGEVTLTKVLTQYWRWLLSGLATLIIMGLVTTYVIRINRSLTLSKQVLQREVAVRKLAQSQLAKHRDTLELRVKERTQELQEDILEREKVEETLRRSESALRELHEITTSAELELEQKLEQLLEMGCEHFELTTGLFSRIYGDEYEIIEVVSPDERFSKGAMMPLKDTFCQITLASKDAIAIENMATSEYRDLPMVQHTGLEAYFGTTVRVAGKNYGTLCFFRTEYYDEPFSSVDCDILQLMAQWIGGEIERQNAQDQARQHQDALAHVSRLGTMGQMASALAHELNQPLTAVVNYARGCILRMQSQSDKPEELVEAMELTVAEAERAAEIIRGLREFVSGGESQRDSIDINSAVREAIRIAEVEARQNRVTIVLNLEDNLPNIEANLIQIEQVILNLVRNGIEAITDDKQQKARELHIHTKLLDDEIIEVAVRDTGRGLPEVPTEEVFHPFFTTKEEGMGMGLSISRSIIEAHGGKLQTRPAETKGSIFYFTLPSIIEDMGVEAPTYDK